MSSKNPLKVTLLNGSNVDCSQFKPELLQRMESLFAFYQTVVVSSKSIEPIQVLQCSVQRVGAPVDGRRDDRGTHLEQPHLGGVFDGRGHRGQRVERIQEIFRQSGHVSVCLHQVRQSPDRIEDLCARRSLRRTRRLLDQDANPGRHDCGFHPAYT